MADGLESSVIVNRLGLVNEVGEVKIDAVQELLGVSKKELAQFFEMSSEELADDKVTAKNKGKLVELAGAIEYVAEAFKGDMDKIKFWFKTPNPNFGNSSPQQLIVNGRSQYVVKFILASRNGY
jgi:hypothetical protein